MANVLISSTFLFLSFCWVTGSPKVFLTPEQLPKGKLFMPVIPESDKAIISEKLQEFCLFKRASSRGNEWTLGMKETIYKKMEKPQDSSQEKFIKKLLIENIVNGATASCGARINGKIKKQEDEDVYEGLTSILTNVFSGNLFGVITSSVGIAGAPEQVGTTVSEVLRTLLGSIETAQEAVKNQAINSPVTTSAPKVNASSTISPTGGTVSSPSGSGTRTVITILTPITTVSG